MNDYIGFIAAFLTTIAFLPQVLQVIKTRSTGDLSLGTYSFFWTGVVMWMVYGIVQGDPAIIIANGITAVLAGIVLIYVISNNLHKHTGKKTN
ncbi:MAG: SemiSWEET transporter [Cellvibrionaceae bacterium]|nr:SemiSWEET transporter [Cellvibrionaceae bacterium]